VLVDGGRGGRGKTVEYADDVDELVAAMSEVAKLTKLWERRILVAWARRVNVGDTGLRWAFDEWLSKQNRAVHEQARAAGPSADARSAAGDYGLSPSVEQPLANLLSGRLTDRNVTADALAPLFEYVRRMLASLAEETGSEPDIARAAAPYASFYRINPHDPTARPQALPAFDKFIETLTVEPVFLAARTAIADPRLTREYLDDLRETARGVMSISESPDLDGTGKLLGILLGLLVQSRLFGSAPYDEPLGETSK
jgi:hypothetical protein